jgi:hypothetical protein
MSRTRGIVYYDPIPIDLEFSVSTYANEAIITIIGAMTETVLLTIRLDENATEELRDQLRDAQITLENQRERRP